MILLSFCSFPWWLAWLLPFLLGLLAGWAIWSKWKGIAADLEAKVNSLNSRIGSLEGDLELCNSRRAEAESDLALAKGRMREMDAEMKELQLSVSSSGDAVGTVSSGIVASDVTGSDEDDSTTSESDDDKGEDVGTNTGQSADSEISSGLSSVASGLAASAGAGLGISDDVNIDENAYAGFDSNNLQIVEGIGPKMESVLKENGVHNWSDLAEKSPDELRGILDGYGDKYRIIDPSSWGAQAALAGAGNWGELVTLQKNLDTGRDDNIDQTPAKIEKMLEKMGSGAAAAKAVSSSGGGGANNAYAKLNSDNLQIIEGIGPKMESVLKENGVNSWADLAGKSDADLQAILGKYGDRYRIIDPKTWSEQAVLARDSKWDELITLQKNLDTGRDSNIGQTDSKLEKVMIKLGYLKRWKQDDLKAVEGIGPKIAGLLNDAGITTWKELSETSVERIQSVLDAAGSRYKLADPSTWPKQAGMAAAGQWDELQEYQDFLQGGKE